MFGVGEFTVLVFNLCTTFVNDGGVFYVFFVDFVEASFCAVGIESVHVGKRVEVFVEDLGRWEGLCCMVR